MQRKIRQSQTIVPFGLAASLGVTEFRSAPAVDSNAWASSSRGIPYARFPSWLFCQQCRRMTRWRRSPEHEDKTPTCANTRSMRANNNLTPAYLSHMDDRSFPHRDRWSGRIAIQHVVGRSPIWVKLDARRFSVTIRACLARPRTWAAGTAGLTGKAPSSPLV